jgi:hypothetical protein
MQRNYIVALCAVLRQHQAGVESEENFGAGKSLAKPTFSKRAERSHLGFRANLCALHRQVVRCSQIKPGAWSEDRRTSSLILFAIPDLRRITACRIASGMTE